MEQIIIIDENIVVCDTNTKKNVYLSCESFLIIGGRQYEDDNGKPSGGDDDYRRRDRDRYNNPSRRDQDTGRSGKYNHHDRGK